MQSIHNYPDISILTFLHGYLRARIARGVSANNIKAWEARGSFPASCIRNNVEFESALPDVLVALAYCIPFERCSSFSTNHVEAEEYVCGILDPRFLSRRSGRGGGRGREGIAGRVTSRRAIAVGSLKCESERKRV